jgi:D-alanyl-D-alanine carboxypeptidase
VFRGVWTILGQATIFQQGNLDYMIARRKAAIRLAILLFTSVFVSRAAAQQANHPASTPVIEKKGSAAHEGHAMLPAELFAARAQLVLGSGQPSKGDWGLLVVDAKTGEVLFEQNADRYFVPLPT